MGLSELDFVNRTTAEARVRPIRKDNGWRHPWKRGGEYEEREIPDYKTPYVIPPTNQQPCAIQRAYEQWVAEGNTGSFSIMMVCTCPNCTIRCGSL